MAYKFQKGTAQLSGTIKLDSGYDLLAVGSNDLGTSAAEFAVGYIGIVSASTVVSGAFFEGNASRMTGIAATDLTTTGTSTNATYYPLFVDTAAGESGETVRVHSTVTINPGKGSLTATEVSASTGTGSFGGGISAGNEGFTVGYTGEVTALQYKTNDITYGDSGITIDSDGGHFVIEQDDADKSVRVVLGATDAGTSGFGIRQADGTQVWGVMDTGAVSGSGALSVGGGITVGQSYSIADDGDATFAAVTGTTISGSGLVSAGGGLNISELFTISAAGALVNKSTMSGSGVLSLGAGATMAGVLNVQSGSIVNGGKVEVTQLNAYGAISGSGAVTVDSVTIGQGYSISSAGAGVLASLNNSSGGITNAGSIAGATTIAMGGALTGATTITGSGVLSVGAGVTLAGVLNVQSGSIVNAGVIEATSLTSSGGLTVDSITLGEDYSISSVGAAVLRSIELGDQDISKAASISGVTGSGFIVDVSMGATGGSYLSLGDNLAEAFFVTQGGTNYLTFVTTNDDEGVSCEVDLTVGANVNSGKFLMLNGGMNFEGQKTLTASVNLDGDGESGIYHYQSHYICSGSSAITINLPSLENGYSMWFKRHPAMTNDVTIAPSGSQNMIDGVNDPVVLETAGASLQLVGSGSKNWYIY